MNSNKNIFKTIIKLFTLLIIFNLIAIRDTVYVAAKDDYFLYNIVETLKTIDFHFYFCLHLLTIILITSISVIVARKKVPDLWVFANKVMWITLLIIMSIHCIGVIIDF
jgi:hypothetical protein